MKVLVIRSGAAAARRVAETLGGAGIEEVSTARSMGEALTALGGGAQSFGLVMMDVSIPDMDGLAACGVFKATPELADIPVIILSRAHDSAELERALGAGAHDYIVEPFHPRELAARARAALRLSEEIRARRERERELEALTASLAQDNEELTELTGTEPLTKLANRRRFEETLRKDLRAARRLGRPLGVLMIDIDHFKPYNDNLGHRAGDLCIKLVGGRIKQTLRGSTDTAARYGGEEFAVILPNTDEQGTRAVCERIRAAVEQMALPHAHSPTAPVVTVSVGAVCLVPADGNTEGQLVAAADKQLYRSKESGRNRSHVTTELAPPAAHDAAQGSPPPPEAHKP